MYAPCMSRPATSIYLTDEERKTLKRKVKASTAQQRMVMRSRIILLAADGLQTHEIAARLSIRPTTVSTWRKRFAERRLDGLCDAARSGKPRRYDEQTERRVLSQLEQPPPGGYASWNGSLIAQALGDVTDHQKGGFCASTALSCSAVTVGASAPIPSLPKRRPISWACICRPRKMPSCSA